MCTFKWDPTEYVDPHTSQENYLFPVCVLMRNFRIDPIENADLQISHENISSQFFFNLVLTENADPQT